MNRLYWRGEGREKTMVSDDCFLYVYIIRFSPHTRKNYLLIFLLKMGYLGTGKGKEGKEIFDTRWKHET